MHNNIHTHKDPDKVTAYAEAPQAVLDGRLTTSRAVEQYKVSHHYLLKKLKKAGELRTSAIYQETIKILKNALADT